MIEARKGNSGLEWQYAFAPMSIYALEGRGRASCGASRPLGPPKPPFLIECFSRETDPCPSDPDGASRENGYCIDHACQSHD